MRKASFSVEKVSSNTDAHNSREHSPKYLIGCEKGKENEYIKYYEYNNFQELAEARYLEVNKQKMQTSQKEALFEEAVISLEEHHTKDDVVKLFESLNKKYTGHTLINLAIHRDEGHFLKDGIEYYPTMHILQKDDGNWYILDENDTEILEALKDKDFKPKAEDFKVKVKIKDFEKVYNYHAHAVFSRFDLKTGKSARFQKSTMSERYKFVSEQMQMNYAPDENRFIKKTIGQHKGDLSATRNAKLVLKKELEQVHLEEKTILKKEIKNLKTQNTKSNNAHTKLKDELQEVNSQCEVLKFDKKELEKQLKESSNQLRTLMKEQGGFKREDYAELDQLKKELEEKLKAKDLTLKELNSKFAKLEEKLLKKEDEKDQILEKLELTTKQKDHFESLVTVKEIEIIEKDKNINSLINQNKALISSKEVLEEKVIALQQKTTPEPNIVPQKEIIDELQNIITEEFIKKDLFESRISKASPVITVKDSKSFLKRVQELATQGVQSVANTVISLKKEINEWKEKYNSLVEILKTKDQKIADLEDKLQTISTKQQNQTQTKNHLKEIVEKFEAHKGDKSDSSLLQESKEVQEEEIKGKIRRDR